MKVKELIEHLKKLDQESNIFLQYDSFMWYNLEPEYIEHLKEGDTVYIEAKELGASINDYKIELG